MEAGDWLRAVAALGVVLGLIGLGAWAVRRYGAQWGMANPAVAPRVRRISVVETQMLDPRRRLVLIRLDCEEHLLLLGATGETVVSTMPVKADGVQP
jgi:flagellar protein FliO/FliZ